jgi:hypothetical protein
MLERCDRVQLAVIDRRTAAARFAELLGTEVVREAPSPLLKAMRTIVALGESEVELCEPDGAGYTAEFVARRGEGLMTAGYSTSDVARLARRLDGLGMAYQRDGDQLHVGPPATFGLPVVVSPATERSRVGPISFLYETTNTLRTDWRLVASVYAGLFGLDPTHFQPISSSRFGYEGTLTLFDPPRRLDRIELSQALDPAFPMGRFVGHHGDSLYMAYAETDDLQAVLARLRAAGARFTPRGNDPAHEGDGCWIYPRELHGLLLGVSRTGLAWEWSGRPELVPPAARAGQRPR